MLTLSSSKSLRPRDLSDNFTTADAAVVSAFTLLFNDSVSSKDIHAQQLQQATTENKNTGRGPGRCL